jgi:hypothetical protein
MLVLRDSFALDAVLMSFVTHATAPGYVLHGLHVFASELKPRRGCQFVELSHVCR